MKNLFTHIEPNSRAFVLPTVIVLSVVLLTLGLSVFQLTSSIARSLTDQYWQKMSKQAAQAGISYVSACIDQGLSGSTWPTTITQDNSCIGNSLGSQPSIFTNTSDTNPIPSKFKSSFTIYKPVTGADGIPKARVVGTVEVLNTAGTSTTKSYTTDMMAIVNGPTRASSKLALGRKHSCALSDGQIYCWGSNVVEAYAGAATNNTILGQLGRGPSFTSSASPTPGPVDISGVLAGKNVIKIASGYNHSCALASGRVYCWGQNDQGQLGNATTGTGSTIPVAVNTSGVLANKVVTDIAAGRGFTCAVAGNLGLSRVYCWGDNNSGQLGNGNTSDSSTPVGPAGGTIAAHTVGSIATGGGHVCVIASNLTSPKVSCWGENWAGQLGRGNTTNSSSPVDVSPALPGIPTSISAGYAHTCAIGSGRAYCWGNNDDGQVGDNIPNPEGSWTDIYNRTSPVAVKADAVGDALYQKSVTSISASSEGFTCAVANSEAYCWGSNWAGQLGIGTTNYYSVPVKVSTSGLLNGKSVTDISLGYYHACSIADGQVYCWGHGTQSQLGNGKYYVTENGDYDSYLPVKSINTF